MLTAPRDELEQAVDAAISALTLAAERLPAAEPRGPPLELILVELGQLLRAGEVRWLAKDLEIGMGRVAAKPISDDVDGKMSDVDADPGTTQFFGR